MTSHISTQLTDTVLYPSLDYIHPFTYPLYKAVGMAILEITCNIIHGTYQVLNWRKSEGGPLR